MNPLGGDTLPLANVLKKCRASSLLPSGVRLYGLACLVFVTENEIENNRSDSSHSNPRIPLRYQSVFAQSNQVTSTVSLSHGNVQLTYPSQVLPGQSATINLTAQAKDSFQLANLTVQVYLADQNNLRQLLSTTVAQNTMMTTGNQINKQIQITVPSDAPRTSLVALVTESVSMTPYSYPNAYAYPYWSGNLYGNWVWVRILSVLFLRLPILLFSLQLPFLQLSTIQLSVRL